MPRSSTPIRRSVLVSATVLLAATPASEAPQEATRILGFTSEASARQLALEARYDSFMDAANLEEWMRYITSKPIYTGSPHNKETAEWMVEQFRSWGFEARLDEYQVLYPLPRVRHLELVEPTRYTARLREPRLDEDATSGIEEDRLPTFNAYSADGDVTAELSPSRARS
jgi:N-acetylated-alpha-linked acidic dipeptidase